MAHKVGRKMTQRERCSHEYPMIGTLKMIGAAWESFWV